MFDSTQSPLLVISQRLLDMNRPTKLIKPFLHGVGVTPSPVQMPGGGAISFSQLRAELGGDGAISMGSGRGLAEVPEGPLAMSNFFGKSTYVPPVENIEWRYNSTSDVIIDGVDHFINQDGSPTILCFWWDAVPVFGDFSTSPLFAGDPVGYRATAPDGRIFQVGAYKTTYNLFGDPLYHEYEIGRVYYT